MSNENTMQTQTEFDNMIGRLDRLLSEFLLWAGSPLDKPNVQTIKHHAGDLIGVGQAALKKIGLMVAIGLFLSLVAQPTLAKPGKRQVRVLGATQQLQKSQDRMEAAIRNLEVSGVFSSSPALATFYKELVVKMRDLRSSTTSFETVVRTAQSNAAIWQAVKPLARLVVIAEDTKYVVSLIPGAARDNVEQYFTLIEIDLHTITDSFVGSHSAATVAWQRKAVAADPGLENYLVGIVAFDRKPIPPTKLRK